MRRGSWLLSVALAMTPVSIAGAAVIGHMTPAEPITADRIARAPQDERAAWSAYLARSQRLMAADRAALAAERAQGAVASSPPAGPSGSAGMPLDRPAAWYASPEARHVADNIVSFQTPAGGWGKNVDRTGPLRRPGEHYAVIENLPANARTDADPDWSYVGTIDNDATTTEIRFLARVQAALPGADGDPYRAAALKGVRYLLGAQFPNGGWPQIYPLRGGYHDALTFNDDALTLVVTTLATVGAHTGDYAFVPASLAAEARAACDRALAVILRTQVVIDGKRTVWGQQHDAITLAPVGARNFEPIALSSSESADLLMFLMKQPAPSRELIAAVDGGIAWLKAHQIAGQDWKPDDKGVRSVIANPAAAPIWARYYDPATGRPIFGDRDRTIHDDVADLSVERRNGYAWYGRGPAKALKAYEIWSSRRH
ncbi:MAG TPA: pectate lyase [Sphingomonas sp.]|nr:pectate lyase [Sphingomonas sp.]